MHPDDQHLLVVGTVEDADAAALRQRIPAAPHPVVVQFLGRRLLERRDLAALRIHAAHHVLDGAVLAGGVHGLEDQQQRSAILRIELVLLVGEPGDAVGQPLLRLGLVLVLQATGVGRIDVLQTEAGSVGHAVRIDEARDALQRLLVHDLRGSSDALAAS